MLSSALAKRLKHVWKDRNILTDDRCEPTREKNMNKMWKDLNQLCKTCVKKKWTAGNKVRKKAWNKQDVNRCSRHWVLVDWTRHVLIFQKHAVNTSSTWYVVCVRAKYTRGPSTLIHELFIIILIFGWNAAWEFDADDLGTGRCSDLYSRNGCNLR